MMFAQITACDLQQRQLYRAALVRKTGAGYAGQWTPLAGEEIAVRSDTPLPLGRVVVVEGPDSAGEWRRVCSVPVSPGGVRK